jgi:hypothetical protein
MDDRFADPLVNFRVDHDHERALRDLALRPGTFAQLPIIAAVPSVVASMNANAPSSPGSMPQM